MREVSSVAENLAAALQAFGLALREVFKRRGGRDDDKHDLSPESQRIQDMWLTGDFKGYNEAVNRLARDRAALEAATKPRQPVRASRAWGTPTIR